jgi:threonine dehydratase
MTQGASKQLVLESAVRSAAERLSAFFDPTPLQKNRSWSDQYEADIFFKREDLNVVRSYKVRGALNKMLSLGADEISKGVVCASAGNHAQGVAYSAAHLGVHATIYMPGVTPQQKVRRVALWGGNNIDIVLKGDDFDDAYALAMEDSKRHGKMFIHPFNDPDIIAGQGTVGLEVRNQLAGTIPDFIIMPIGGGGLSSGVSTVLKKHYPECKFIGAEPLGAPAMHNSIQNGSCVELRDIDGFVDGAAVRKVGNLTYQICAENLDRVLLVPEGKLCTTILQLYDEEAIVAEPAGVLALSALDQIREEIRGKKVVCILSGGNNDILRMEEIKERSLLHEGLKHYFIIRFPQRAGALKEFLNALGPDDDISHFEYTKKNNRAKGPALVGIELKRKEDYHPLLQRMDKLHINYQTLNDSPLLFEMLV